MGASDACNFKVGDFVMTDFDRQNKWTTHEVKEVQRRERECQSGWVIKVDPPPRLCSHEAWIDIGWFVKGFKHG